MVASTGSRRYSMKLAIWRVSIGGVVLLLLLAGTTGLFKENVHGSLNVQVRATTSGADLTLYSSSTKELKHNVELRLDQYFGNPEDCACDENDVCMKWGEGGKLYMVKGDKEGLWKITAVSSSSSLEMCFPLEGQQLYGGPVLMEYPAQRVNIPLTPYITGDTSRLGIIFNVMERYWYTSGGMNLKVDAEVPLFIKQNESALCLYAMNKFPYSKDVPVKFSYYTYIGASNAKEAVKHYFPHYDKPIPPKKVIEDPIWSTWVQFKKDIDQNKVLQFERDIKKNGFNASVIEIDDSWETCYGSQTFDLKRFPDPTKMVNILHSYGNLVTMWRHPFVGPGCPLSAFKDFEEKLVRLPNGTIGMTTWWNGDGAIFDFLNPKTSDWYKDRLTSFMETYGIDGFKFDAGEAAYLPGMSIKEGLVTLPQPNLYTTEYIKMAAHFGTLTEARVGAESFQYKIMQRLQDRYSVWDSENLGLRSVIKAVLQLSLLGYGAILPDMVGGNAYNNQPSKELFIRWIQLNTFLPVIQFSLAPWSFDEETVAITRKFTSLHHAYAERILKEFKDTRHPVINPIWWISPNDKIALVTSSEFLLGEDLLVAPVLEEGATDRDIYLPAGQWRDENNGTVYKGPITLRKYPAPLDFLPYFERISPA